MEHEIEAVARALYAAEDDAQVWEREPEILKAEFRRHARGPGASGSAPES
jgi:hypothetical protein